jgi:aspartate/methionine/tyrosine aminotransferase
MVRSGTKVYSLSVGDTHFSPAFSITDKLENLPKNYSHYTVGQGIPELREEISLYNKSVFSAHQIIITPGLKQGLYYALMAMDEKKLCVLEPAWLGYKALAQITGKEYVPVNTNGNDWLGKLSEVDFHILLVCSPNNPNGKILDRKTIDEITTIAAKKNAWIITDEIYDLYDFRAEPYDNPIKALHQYERIVVGNGLSKSHAMTGFRIGYIMAMDKMLIQTMNNIHQNLATCAPAISQYLSIGFSMLSQMNQFRDYYKINRDLVSKLFPQISSFKPDGGFYYFIDLKEFGLLDADKFCKQLLESRFVAVVPGSAYGTGFESFIRLSFSVDHNELEQALPIIKTFIEEL